MTAARPVGGQRPRLASALSDRHSCYVVPTFSERTYLFYPYQFKQGKFVFQVETWIVLHVDHFEYFKYERIRSTSGPIGLEFPVWMYTRNELESVPVEATFEIQTAYK